jgi:hypothetical protein
MPGRLNTRRYLLEDLPWKLTTIYLEEERRRIWIKYDGTYPPPPYISVGKLLCAWTQVIKDDARWQGQLCHPNLNTLEFYLCSDVKSRAYHNGSQNHVSVWYSE